MEEMEEQKFNHELFARRVRFTCGYIWRAVEEVQAELQAASIALPMFAQELLEDISVRADAIAEEAKEAVSQ